MKFLVERGRETAVVGLAAGPPVIYGFIVLAVAVPADLARLPFDRVNMVVP